MAFDQTTRNRLQSFVSKARAILSEEFTRQLQATYGLDPKQGTIADIGSLSHLDNYQLQTAHILRETVQHYMTTTAGKIQKEQVKQVLERIVREQAFTVLNRLAALRMAEARGFLLESIGSGYSSQGFQLYQMLEDGSHGETGDAYQSYLFSLFDEFGLDLAVLFDRFSVQGRLFPRETALLQLLEQINDYEIEPLWAEDETIGWIYQYFNSQEERKKMRSESSAPRNSRELAVRNQFFTPRYVVEFLTDNTLGRIWYEMTKGDTALVDSCQYLVKRPNEVFLSQGENSPIQNESSLDENLEALTQEEILKQPVYIPSRPLKDPRTIRMLDPACGSMHFGLYAFDLFERIYIEAWQIEAEQGADVFERESDLVSLHSTFEDIESFKQQIPKLIIEHNIHGVDIDPRAVQIAGLSLWQRAQRAWHEQGVKPNQRPTIVKSNIVCAEPMPGEQDLLKEFTSTLNPPALGQLVEVIFDKMSLAGEAGTLLKIEQEIESAISKARQQWDKTKDISGIRDLFEEELRAATPQQELGFDLSGIDGETFWEDAEQLILRALQDYSERATSASGEKRLFAEDAAKGFAFIDLCRKRFDVVLMNPPFGECSNSSRLYLDKTYPKWSKNLLCAFIERGWEIGSTFGKVGVIFDRTAIVKSSYEKFRRASFVSNNRISVLADLGWEVLDANVEVTSSVLSHNHETEEGLFIDLRDLELKGEALKESIELRNSNKEGKAFSISLYSDSFQNLPNSVVGYDFPEYLIRAFSEGRSLSTSGYVALTGHQFPTERHFRLWWEVSQDKPPIFVEKLFNGSGFNPYWTSLRDILISPVDIEKLPSSSSITLRNSKFHKKPGICFGKRGEFFCAQLLPAGYYFSLEGLLIPVEDSEKALEILAVLNTPLARSSLNRFTGQHKTSGYVNLFPYRSLNRTSDLKSKILKSVFLIREIQTFDETLESFNLRHFTLDIKTVSSSLENKITQTIALVKECEDLAHLLAMKAYDVSDRESKTIEAFRKTQPSIGLPIDDIDYDEGCQKFVSHTVVSILLGYVMGRWNLKEEELLSEKKYYFDPDDCNAPFVEHPSVFQSRLLRGSFHTCEESESFRERPANVAKSGIFEVSSKGLRKIQDVLKLIFTDESQTIENQIIEVLDFESIYEYFNNPKGFFSHHLKRYSKSRRQAPLYWPLQTPLGSYTLWVYYHRLNTQTLYSCVNDFVEPKLALVTEDLNALSNKSNRSRIEEKELAQLTDLQNELKDFRDELLRLAKVWKPNLNDGVQITAAPLWKLFQHTAWQKKLKETWENLEEGEYDWAHLAASIWPDRVLRKCHQDRSLAIAHDVEDLFWQEVEVPVMRGKKPTGKTKLEWQPIPTSETTLNDMVNEAKARLQ